ncbi:MAG TPA: hypothetical protein VFX97_09320 [Pyrinomonadaceae bacterium]|nr:hypothetical protein [Pyrinomonadaceae bacterium]
MRITLACLLLVLLSGTVAAQQCPFDTGDENRLARCLIRPVARGGNVGQAPETLPGVLEELVGKPMNIDLVKLRQHLTESGITESAIGGTLVQNATKVRYFVIHDTSSPEIAAADFPANINDATWSGNRLATWLGTNTPVHMFVNRLGESATKTNFSAVARGTKYEGGRDIANLQQRQQARQRRGGLFVHVELIQPRRKSNPNTFFDLGPTPGFTQKQLDRLALLYIAASFRSNRWLLPAFHASVDASIAEAHDDPQNFDISTWLSSVKTLVDKVKQ